MQKRRTDDGGSAAAAAAIPDRGCAPSSIGGRIDFPGNAADDVAAGFAADDDGKTDDASTCSSSLDGCFYAETKDDMILGLLVINMAIIAIPMYLPHVTIHVIVTFSHYLLVRTK